MRPRLEDRFSEQSRDERETRVEGGRLEDIGGGEMNRGGYVGEGQQSEGPFCHLVIKSCFPILKVTIP